MNRWILAFSLFTFNLIQANASEADGLDVIPAINKAIEDIAVEVDQDSLFSWEGALEKDEVVVKMINVDGVQAKYGCHHHDKEMTCHEELFRQTREHYHKDPEATLKFMKDANASAITKFKRTLSRRNKDFSVVSSMKVWVHEEDHDGGHEHGVDVWTKFDYNLGQDATIFTVCHVHGDEKSFSCHYSKKGEGEPVLSF
tara:strand:+ start:84 stop:680 length:597 start_codon:yes stop_codon:yes gene_type:complete